MFDLDICPEIAENLGPELLDRIYTDASLTTGECAICTQPINPANDSLVLVAYTDSSSLQTSPAHQRCSSSKIVAVGEEEMRKRTRNASADVRAAATVYGSRPALLLNHVAQFDSSHGHRPECLDMVTRFYLHHGWSRTSTVATTDETTFAIPRHILQWVPTGPNLLAQPATFTLVDPENYTTHINNFTVLCPPYWVRKSVQGGYVDVYVGPFGIHTWSDEEVDEQSVRSALSSGRVTAATVSLSLGNGKFDV